MTFRLDFALYYSGWFRERAWDGEKLSKKEQAQTNMNNTNVVVIQGRLCWDPRVRTLLNGSTVANFTIAVNTRFKTRSGEVLEEVAYVNCVIWGPIAEWVGERKKPELLLVTGHLKTEEWEESGENRSKLVVICDQVQHLQFPPHINPREALDPAGESQPATQPPF